KRFGFILPEQSYADYSGGLDRFAAKLRDNLTKLLHTPVYLYVGDPIEDLRQLGQSYRSATTAAMYKFIVEGGVLIIDQLADLPLNYVDLDQSMTKQLTEQVEENNETAILDSIDDIFAEFRKHYYAPEAVKLAIHQCVTALAKIMKRMD